MLLIKETRQVPTLVVVNVEIDFCSFEIIDFNAYISDGGCTIRVDGRATRIEEGSTEWKCQLDESSYSKIHKNFAKHGHDLTETIDACEAQICSELDSLDPFRPEFVSGMAVCIRNVSLADSVVMALWSVRTANGGYVICALPVFDESGAWLDLPGMTRTLQWILRSDRPLEDLVPRLLSAVETEGRRLIGVQTELSEGQRTLH